MWMMGVRMEQYPHSFHQTATTTNTIHSLLNHFQRHTHNLPVTITHDSDSVHCIDLCNTFLQFWVLHGDSAACIHHISLLNEMILYLL